MAGDITPGGVFSTGQPPWTVNSAARPAKVKVLPPLTTRYQFSWLTPDGGVEDGVRMGPSTPLFTEAFTAFARGTLIQTTTGPIAIEDLLPGDRIVTSVGAATLRWKGSRVIAPLHKDMPLHRIASEALGPSRPLPDLLVGPAARIVSRRTSLRAMVGTDAALVPAASLADDNSVIRIRPISAIQVFHLGFARHSIFTANGVEVESAHPGTLSDSLGREIRSLYLSMFPHHDNLPDFGELAMPRLRGEDLRRLTALA
ncbi:Hint domain-containing protein [Palleronia abyssalis]|uniref:Hedgehog/Intein (Hint) domain-containing protein n=1 Tax=Palleronia abyssalis TaxID=1501240 RepID=A0A2R8BY71_9RHOB|nr:Hint domain-containing protein [Palleronia abyssalis]SPJ25079.1 hypothetical protein PAA8504_02924 [Palleronia abyssalis]